MAFMLIAVTLFFVLAGLFVFTVLFSNVKTSAKIIEQENAILLVSKLANSPELSCESAFDGSRLNCVDSDKAMALAANIEAYKNFWGIEGIVIRKIYPDGSQECNSFNYPDCNVITVLDAGEGTGVSNFVALCKKINVGEGNETKIENDCELGKLIVTYNG